MRLLFAGYKPPSPPRPPPEIKDEATQKQKLAIFASLIWVGVGGGGGCGYKFSILI